MENKILDTKENGLVELRQGTDDGVDIVSIYRHDDIDKSVEHLTDVYGTRIEDFTPEWVDYWVACNKERV